MPYSTLDSSWVIAPRYVPYLTGRHPSSYHYESLPDIGKYDNAGDILYGTTKSTHLLFNSTGGESPYNIRCTDNKACPLGTECYNGHCRKEFCHYDRDSSSGKCSNSENHEKPNRSTLHTCQINSDCPTTNNCLNGVEYIPDQNKNYYCGRRLDKNLAEQVYSRYSNILPSYNY